MNKKLLAVAIGAALAAPMYAANAAVTVGGQAHISADYVDTIITGIDTRKVWNISSNVSNIFFKAEEDLGGGLKGVAYLQQYFRFDNQYGQAPTTATGANNRWFDAPAYAGLSGGFGTILLGTQDGPAKLVGRSVDLFGNMIGDSRSAGEDNTRVSNSISYTTPTFGGVSIVGMVGTNQDNALNTATQTAQASSQTLGVNYAGGPVKVSAAYMQILSDANNATTYADNIIMNLGVSFQAGPARIVGYYQQNNAAGNVDGTDNTTYGLGVAFKFGNETVKAQYYSLTNSSLAFADRSSSVYAIGFDHAFSKTFTGYVAVAVADNDLGNTVSMTGGGGHGDNVAVGSGESNSGLSLGIIYNF